MKPCDCCGNEYANAFEVVFGGARYTFDCFECAIHKLAPSCIHCGCKVIGHGVEAQGALYCCAHCARREGEARVRDHVG
jgi:hypothetical protein